MAKKLSDRKRYNFSNDWFDYNVDLWDYFLKNFKGQDNNILEIGSFEGASTTWLLDELCSKESSSLIAIDTFMGSIEHSNDDFYGDVLSNLETRFNDNILKSDNSDKLRLIKEDSSVALPNLLGKGARFNLIYVDASHTAYDVLRDTIMSWSMLEFGGVLVLDDYRWHEFEDDFDNPKLAIDSFLRCFEPELDVLHKDFQVIVRKKLRNAKFKPTHEQRKQREEQD